MSVEILRRSPTEYRVVDLESGRIMGIEEDYWSARVILEHYRAQRDACDSLHGRDLFPGSEHLEKTPGGDSGGGTPNR